ncbi:MAG: aminotransferase class I/II-fold pyridoxal phosphate-dependent enzyme, partial [Planctomycetota bacterium]
DDAHGTGVLGATGSGTAEALGVVDRVHVHIGTLSKALGGQGGFVAGSRKLIDWLLQTARPYIFTTALAPASAAAATEAVRLIADEAWRRERVLAVAQRVRDELTALGFALRPAPLATPIIAVQIGDAHAAVQLSQALEQRGLLVPAVRPPTVPVGTSRLRVTLMADHTDDDVALALRAFASEAGPNS